MPHTDLYRHLILALQRARRANLSAEGKPHPVAKPRADWSRRRFLKTAALAGAAATALPRVGQSLAGSPGGDAPRIAILGGGIAGLHAAFQLQQAGIFATVYEAQGRVGGRILTVQGAIGAGIVTDLGAELINSDHEDILALVREFDLDLIDRRADAARFPFPATGYLFGGAAVAEAELAEDLRPLAAQITADSERLDEDYERAVHDLDRLSVTDYLDRHSARITRPYIRALLETSIRSEYGVEPDDSSALQLIFNLPTVAGRAVEILGNSDEAFVVAAGTGKLIDALARRLADRIRTRMALTRIEKRGGRFRLHFAGGETVEADYVMVTIPFPVLRRLELAVPLPRRLRRFIDEFDLGRNDKVIAGFRERAWRQPQGFAADAWTDLGYAAVWDATQRQPERADGALTFFTGGREVTLAGGGTARSVGRAFVRRLDSILPGVRAASTDRFLRTAWSQNRFSGGAYSNFRPGQLTEFGGLLWIEADDPSERQEVAVGNLIFAGEHLSDAYYGFMNGAAETGRLAAERVLRHITD